MSDKGLESVDSSSLELDVDLTATCSTRNVGAMACYMMGKRSGTEHKLIQRLDLDLHVRRNDICIIGSRHMPPNKYQVHNQCQGLNG